MDPLFRVKLVGQMPAPQRCVYVALHQDYSEGFSADEPADKTEEEYGKIIIKRLLSGNRGHFGCLEHPQIILNAGWFPHSVMQQARTHRAGCSWDVQSGRYTGQRILKVAESIEVLNLSNQEHRDQLEEVFYLRPVGEHRDRQGKRYVYTQEWREADLEECFRAAKKYAEKLNLGYSEEHARGMLPFDTRQHFVVSFNCRSLMHFLDLRAKADAQQEIQHLCELMFLHFKAWMPEIADWYYTHRWGKANLAP